MPLFLVWFDNHYFLSQMKEKKKNGENCVIPTQKVDENALSSKKFVVVYVLYSDLNQMGPLGLTMG